MSTLEERCAAELQGLGLSALEAAIWLHLARSPRSTGYRVAHALGKPAANVYAALESLRRKGAIVVEPGESRMYRALPADTLQRVLEEKFRERTGRLANVLAQWHAGADDAGVYRLADPGQVFAQAHAMVRKAKAVILADLFPGPVDRLGPALEKAAARGRTVALQAYQSTSLAGVEVIVSHRGADVIARWPGQWISLVVDGGEYLIALLSEDGSSVVHSTWTRSPHLAWVHHSSLSGEMIATHLIAALEQGESAGAVRALARGLQDRLRPARVEGYERLLHEADVAAPRGAPRARKGA
jgi:sugar-specific transcriptional regulator TrmB